MPHPIHGRLNGAIMLRENSFCAWLPSSQDISLLLPSDLNLDWNLHCWFSWVSGFQTQTRAVSSSFLSLHVVFYRSWNCSASTTAWASALFFLHIYLLLSLFPWKKYYKNSRYGWCPNFSNYSIKETFSSSLYTVNYKQFLFNLRTFSRGVSWEREVAKEIME